MHVGFGGESFAHIGYILLRETQAQKFLFCLLWVLGFDTIRKLLSIRVDRIYKFLVGEGFGPSQFFHSRILIITQNVCELLELWVAPGIRFNHVQLHQFFWLATLDLGYRKDVMISSTMLSCKMLAS